MILPDIASRTKEGVLREMVHTLTQLENQANEGWLLDILLERESLGSTGIREGVAKPHGKSKEVDKILASLARSMPGVGFQSLNGKLTHLSFLLNSPENSPGIHLKILAQISRLMKDAAFRNRLMEARSEKEIHSIFSGGGKD